MFSIFLLVMSDMLSAQYDEKASSLNHEAALRIAMEANAEAQKLVNKLSIAVWNNSGVVFVLFKGDNVESHDTEASRRKA